MKCYFILPSYIIRGFCYKFLFILNFPKFNFIVSFHIPASVFIYTFLFTFMLPCIVIDFFLNNQPDALIIQNLFCYKTVHVSGIFSAHHQEFSTVHSALVSFLQVFDDRFQAESGCDSIIQIYSVIKLYMFRANSLSIIRSSVLYIRHW